MTVNDVNVPVALAWKAMLDNVERYMPITQRVAGYLMAFERDGAALGNLSALDCIGGFADLGAWGKEFVFTAAAEIAAAGEFKEGLIAAATIWVEHSRECTDECLRDAGIAA